MREAWKVRVGAQKLEPALQSAKISNRTARPKALSYRHLAQALDSSSHRLAAASSSQRGRLPFLSAFFLSHEAIAPQTRAATRRTSHRRPAESARVLAIEAGLAGRPVAAMATATPMRIVPGAFFNTPAPSGAQNAQRRLFVDMPVASGAGAAPSGSGPLVQSDDQLRQRQRQQQVISGQQEDLPPVLKAAGTINARLAKDESYADLDTVLRRECQPSRAWALPRETTSEPIPNSVLTPPPPSQPARPRTTTCSRSSRPGPRIR